MVSAHAAFMGILLSQADFVAHWVCFADFGPSRIVPNPCAARNLAVTGAGPNSPGSSRCCSGQHPWQPICPSRNHKSFHRRYLGIGVPSGALRECGSEWNPAPELGLFHALAPGQPPRSEYCLRSIRRQLGLFRTIHSESRRQAALRSACPRPDRGLGVPARLLPANGGVDRAPKRDLSRLGTRPAPPILPRPQVLVGQAPPYNYSLLHLPPPLQPSPAPSPAATAVSATHPSSDTDCARSAARTPAANRELSPGRSPARPAGHGVRKPHIRLGHHGQEPRRLLGGQDQFRRLAGVLQLVERRRLQPFGPA